MGDIQRANIIYALAEVLQDSEVIKAIEDKSGNFNSSEELQELEEKIMHKVVAYRTQDLWPPKIEPITKVMKFDS